MIASFFSTISKHNYLIQFFKVIAVKAYLPHSILKNHSSQSILTSFIFSKSSVKSTITLFILQNPIHQPFLNSFYASLFLNVLNNIAPSLMNYIHYKRQLYHDSFVFVPVSFSIFFIFFIFSSSCFIHFIFMFVIVLSLVFQAFLSSLQSIFKIINW